MVNVDVVSEVIIDAPSNVVYKAILDKDSGVVNWGMPYMEVKLKEGSPIGVNMVGDAILYSGRRKSKIIFKVTKIVENKLIHFEYLNGGDFLGNEEYTFEPVDGKTRMKWEMNAQPKRLLLIILAPMLKKTILDSWQKQCMLLNKYLSHK